MRRLLPLLFGLLVSAAWAQSVSVVFKAFPPDYEVFSGGDRLSYTPRGDGLRSYVLPGGTVRVSLSAAGMAPLSLTLDVKAGMGAVQAKLEPRSGPLSLVAEAATGRYPRSVSFSADGKRLYVALQGEPGVDVYDVPSLKKTGRLAAPSGPAAGYTDALPVGAAVWAVTNDGRVVTFDAKTLAFADATDLTGGGNAFLSDLGSGRASVTNWDTGALLAIDTATKKVTASVKLSGALRDFTWAKGTGYASIYDKAQILVIDGTSWKVKATWSVGTNPRPLGVLGNTLFVGDMGAASVYLLDAATGKRTGSVAVPSIPHAMAVSQTASLVAVASRGKNNPSDYQLPGPEYGRITLLSAAGGVLGTVWGRNQPTGLAFSSDGKYLAFTDYLDNNLELYRVSR